MSHKHSHNLNQEVIVARIFWLVIIVYFLLEVFLALNRYDLLGPRLMESGGFSLFWGAITDIWRYRLGPIFMGLSAIAFGIFVFSLFKVWPIRQKISIFSNPHAHSHGAHSHAEHGTPALPARNPAVLKHWTDIVRRANTGTPENLRWAVMEADALVDLVLKERQLSGETMADRLANFRRDEYKTIDKLWDAHKLRNEIAHTPGFRITSQKAERALFAYRDFLKEIKAF